MVYYSMKKVILYKSIFGSTKQYAHWLAEELESEFYKFSQLSDAELKEYDQIIVMSATYAGWMPLTGFLQKKWSILKDKEVFVIAVGGVPADDPASKLSYEKIPEEIRKKIKYAKIPGATPFAKAGKREQEIKKENLTKVLAELGW